MNIRKAALGADPQNIEAAVAAAIKAAESASAALDSLTVSLMLVATFLRPSEPLKGVSGDCRHGQTFTVETMGDSVVMCHICGDQVPDAITNE